MVALVDRREEWVKGFEKHSYRLRGEGYLAEFNPEGVQESLRIRTYDSRGRPESVISLGPYGIEGTLRQPSILMMGKDMLRASGLSEADHKTLERLMHLVENYKNAPTGYPTYALHV